MLNPALTAGQRACLLIPFYQQAVLLETLASLQILNLPILVVLYEDLPLTVKQILAKQPGVEWLALPGKPKKGRALAAALDWAYQQNFDLAVSLDAIGPYDPQDILRLLKETGDRQNTLVIGIAAAQVYAKQRQKRFRKIFSNFWFWIETGINLPDTLSTLKVYPVKPMHHLAIRFRGESWEMEALARAVWGGVLLKSAPLNAFPDQIYLARQYSLRQSFWLMGVHLYLVFRRLLPLPFRHVVEKPRLVWPATWKGKLQLIWDKYLWQAKETPGEAAVSIGFGVFTGLSPFWGWHTLIALYFAQRLHLNKVLVVGFSYISLPPLIPLIIYASLIIGRFCLTGDWIWHVHLSEFSFTFARARLKEFILGGMILSTLGGIISGGLSFVFLRYLKPLF